jgi:hypothetical protein
MNSSGLESSCLFMAKNKNRIIHAKGGWINTSGLYTSTTATNAPMESNTYSFVVTLKRLANATSNFASCLSWSYGTTAGDNYMFGIQAGATGSNGILSNYRLNTFNTLNTLSVSIGATTKFVGTVNNTTGTLWRGISTSSSSSFTRDVGRVLGFFVRLDSPDFELTNLAIFNRLITTNEKDAYYNGTLPLFL